MMTCDDDLVREIPLTEGDRLVSKLHQALGLDDLLAAADSSLPGWGLCHPDVGRLLRVDDVVVASRTGSLEARDEVLFQLARLARTTGGDGREAAAVLCHLLVPGVVAKLGRMPLPLPTDRVNELAAQHLWMQCRTFPCEARPKVAPTIVWNVRRAVLADLGLSDRVWGDKTWANTVLVGHRLLDVLDFVAEPDGCPEPGEELAELLEQALTDGVITREQLLLVAAVVRVAGQAAATRVTRHGLLSAEVSRRVGQEFGMGASTVRTRVGQTVNALRDATRAAA